MASVKSSGKNINSHRLAPLNRKKDKKAAKKLALFFARAKSAVPSHNKKNKIKNPQDTQT